MASSLVWSMAWRNIWRQPRRTLLSATAVMLTCGLMIFLPALQLGSYQAMIKASISIVDGMAQIQRSEYLDTPAMRTTFKPTPQLTNAVLDELMKATPAGAASVKPWLAKRSNGFALVSSDERSFGLQVIGVEPEKEPYISSIPGNIREGRYLQSKDSRIDLQSNDSQTDAAEIVLGAVLATNLHVTVGDRVTLLGTGKDGSLAADSLLVVGIFASGLQALDRQLAEIPITRFNDTFSMQGEIHAWVVYAPQQSLLGSYSPTLQERLTEENLSIRDWSVMQPALFNAIKLDISSALAMYLVLILVIVFSLLNSSLMSVLERTREFGMMMALGVKTNLLGKIIWVESFMVMALGVVSGLIIGGLVTAYYQYVGITFSGAEVVYEQFGLSSTIHPLLNAFSWFIGPAAIGSCLVLAGIYPGLRIRHLQIVTAMRAV